MPRRIQNPLTNVAKQALRQSPGEPLLGPLHDTIGERPNFVPEGNDFIYDVTGAWEFLDEELAGTSIAGLSRNLSRTISSSTALSMDDLHDRFVSEVLDILDKYNLNLGGEAGELFEVFNIQVRSAEFINEDL